MRNVYIMSILIAIPFGAIGFFSCVFEQGGLHLLLGVPSIGLILAWIYIYKHVDSTKNRIKLFLLNPVLYYFIVMLWVVYDFSIRDRGFWQV